MRISEISLKKHAKKIKKEKSIAHNEALDLVVKEYGFQCWKHYKSSSAHTPLDATDLSALITLITKHKPEDVEEFIDTSDKTLKIKANGFRINQIGEYFLKERNHQMAISLFRMAEPMKYAIAINNLGTMYIRGQGVEVDDSEAFRLFYKAAELGFSGAQNNVGTMYQQGKGVEKSHLEALSWYKKADESGSLDGTSNLAWLYKFGDENLRDYKKASIYFKKAAKSDDADSQFYVGMMYYNGEGVPKNNQLAIKWLSKAASKGFANSQCNLANIYHEEGQYREARFWYEEASRNGHILAKKILRSYLF